MSRGNPSSPGCSAYRSAYYFDFPLRRYRSSGIYRAVACSRRNKYRNRPSLAFVGFKARRALLSAWRAGRLPGLALPLRDNFADGVTRCFPEATSRFLFSGWPRCATPPLAQGSPRPWRRRTFPAFPDPPYPHRGRGRGAYPDTLLLPRRRGCDSPRSITPHPMRSFGRAADLRQLPRVSPSP